MLLTCCQGSLPVHLGLHLEVQEWQPLVLSSSDQHRNCSHAGSHGTRDGGGGSDAGGAFATTRGGRARTSSAPRRRAVDRRVRDVAEWPRTRHERRRGSHRRDTNVTKSGHGRRGDARPHRGAPSIAGVFAVRIDAGVTSMPRVHIANTRARFSRVAPPASVCD
jgi:hypothetical protein